MVCTVNRDNPFGIEEATAVEVSADYLEAVREFIKRQAMLLDFIEAERSLLGEKPVTLTAADCIPKGLDEDLTDRLIIIKPAEYPSLRQRHATLPRGFPLTDKS
jgi:hypothetical protein